MLTCGPAHGRSGTDLPNGTGWTAPRTTSTTRRRCGSSRSTPTAWPAAHPGAWTRKQARWLETRLAEVHSAYRGPDGSDVRTGHDDRLVIVFSHHGTDTLDNSRGGHAGPDGEPLLGAGLVALLHRFPNVVLWLNGHTHTNTIRPRPDPADPKRGFWEVTTCAVVDWPCQTRVVELLDHGEYLSIVTTMVGSRHAGGAVPAPGNLG